MKIPKYIDEALKRRTRNAILFNKNDYIIAEWLDRNGIDVEDYDIYLGCESLVNPVDSERRIRKAIVKGGGVDE